MTLLQLAELFAGHFGQALEMMSGEKPALTVAPLTSDAASEGLLAWEQAFDGDGVVLWVAGPESGWIDLGALLLKGAGIDDADAPTSKSTFLEVLNQALSGLGRDLAPVAGRETNPTAGNETSKLPPDREWFKLEIGIGTAPPAPFLLAFSDGVKALLTTPPPVEPTPAATPAQKPGLSAALEGSRTFELLLDVELPVSVSFGRAQLPLKDVIKLTSGSIVELNRAVGEPVEIIVNNCVIARGEVVVVEGNFGVRIQQVISKQERLRTLY